MPSPITKLLPGESENHFIVRLGDAKSNGLLDMTWQELSDIFNKELRSDPTEYYSESAYRKRYALFRTFKEEFGGEAESADAEELRELRRELEKEKVKVRDERNEYRRLLREEARKESYLEQFVRAVTNSARESALDYEENARFKGVLKTDKDMIIPLTDIHCGLHIENFWNKYDGDILKDRLNNYLDRIFEIQLTHGCENAFVVISESISGLIHSQLRIENNQDVIDQFITVTDYISDFIAAISYRFNNVDVYVAPGNHSRVVAKKEDALPHENLDHLLIPFLSAKLQNFKNISFNENKIEQGIAMFAVRGLNVAAIHGDLDKPENVVDNLVNLTGIKFDLVLLGHRHSNGFWTRGRSNIIQSGCLSGVDSYAIQGRLNDYPQQAVVIIDKNEGLDCIYNIKFR